MRFHFSKITAVVTVLFAPGLLAAPPDANRITLQMATAENGRQVRVYGIAHRRRGELQHHLCFADFTPGTATADLPQLTQAMNGSPRLFTALWNSRQLAFPAEALAETRLEDGHLDLIAEDAPASPLSLPPCSRFELREFGPKLPAPEQMPGWTCTGQSGNDEHVTVTLLQSDFRHLQAYAFVNQARLAEWGAIDFHRRVGEYVFQGYQDGASFRLSASPRGTSFDATLELMTRDRHFDVRDVRCTVADR